jgi:uncharacterized membrane protein
MEEMIAQCTEMMDQMQNMMGSGMMGGGMMNNSGMMGSGSPWLASPWYWLGWVLVPAVLVGLFIALLSVIRRPGHVPAAAETPLMILKRRYAQGEIPPEQFETMKRQLAEV